MLEQGAFQGIESAPDDGVRNDWWNVKWMPVTQNASGDNLCIDLDPAKGGAAGQMISVWHDAPERTILAASFQEWVERFATGLEAIRVFGIAVTCWENASIARCNITRTSADA